MPTYEYECQKCHKHFEEFQKMSDPPIKCCPFCQGRVVRLISGGAGLIFKGSGFYITDYKKTSASTSESTKPKSSDKKETKVTEKATDKQSGGEAAAKTTEKKETKEKKDTKEKKETNKDAKKDA